MKTSYSLKDLSGDTAMAQEFVRGMDAMIPDGGRSFVEEFRYTAGDTKTGIRAECRKFVLEYTGVRLINESGKIVREECNRWEIRTENPISEREFGVAHTFDIGKAVVVELDSGNGIVKIYDHTAADGEKRILKVLEAHKLEDFGRKLFMEGVAQ